MVNSWSLLWEELNGTMDETYPIKKNKVKKDDDGWDDDGFSITGNPNASPDTIIFSSDGVGAADTVSLDFDYTGSGLIGGLGNDHISFDVGAGNTGSTGNYYFGEKVDDVYAYHYPGTDIKPQPDLKYKSQKYQEDKGIADLKDYVSSTYQGHYTNDNSDVQTLDLIHSVGDAESFCRSNALKYLSRYDKKGSAKKDILKAMHYCLLLYYFSGNTQEPDYTNTRYETF